MIIFIEQDNIGILLFWGEKQLFHQKYLLFTHVIGISKNYTYM